ncbi:hypothetical protein ACFQ6V_00615 [Streptomyces roseifaciens]
MRHPVIVPQVHRIAVRSNWAVVMPWHEGEVLYHPTAGGTADRTAPGSAMARFRALPLPLATRAWEQVLSAHLAVEEAGYVAVDFYDGALLYDFTGNAMRLIDLDEYRPGPFVLEEDRLPGSRRFHGAGGVRARRDHRRPHHRLRTRSRRPAAARRR